MSNESPDVVTVVVIEDHPLYRRALEEALKATSDLQVVACAANGPAGLKAIRENDSDVALLDLALPGIDGMTILAELDDVGSRTKVVVLTASEDGGSAFAALAAGAVGYITKDAHAVAICNAVRAAARGETVLARRMEAHVATAIRSSVRASHQALSTRERAVVSLAARGYSSDQIGTELAISPSTVKAHFAAVYDKLGVSDRAAAVAQALTRGLISQDLE